MERCNIEKYEKGSDIDIVECGRTALWKHPRWPDGLWCDHCRGTVLVFFPEGWTGIEEGEDGK